MVLSSFISTSPENCKKNTEGLSSCHSVPGFESLSCLVRQAPRRESEIANNASVLFLIWIALIIAGFLSSV